MKNSIKIFLILLIIFLGFCDSIKSVSSSGSNVYYPIVENININTPITPTIRKVVDTDDNSNISNKEFQSNSLLLDITSNLIGGLLATLITWFLLEKRIQKTIDMKNKLLLLNNLIGDLNFDLWFAEELIRNREDYLNNNKISFANYKTKGLEDFLYQKPIKLDNSFYQDLQKLTQRYVDVDNEILRSIREHDLGENKKVLLDNANFTKTEIISLLERSESIRKKILR